MKREKETGERGSEFRKKEDREAKFDASLDGKGTRTKTKGLTGVVDI